MSYVAHKNFCGSVKSYLIAFVLSIVLTIIPFMLAINDYGSHAIKLGSIVGMAIMQVIVHLIFFLHINTRLEECWNLAALLFTTVIIGIIVVGSLWIMYNLNSNMLVS